MGKQFQKLLVFGRCVPFRSLIVTSEEKGGLKWKTVTFLKYVQGVNVERKAPCELDSWDGCVAILCLVAWSIAFNLLPQFPLLDTIIFIIHTTCRIPGRANQMIIHVQALWMIIAKLLSPLALFPRPERQKCWEAVGLYLVQESGKPRFSLLCPPTWRVRR